MKLSSRFNFPSSLLAGTATIATLVIVQPTVLALTSEKVGQIAIPVTVQINPEKGGGGSGVIIDRKGNTYTVLTCIHVFEYPKKPGIDLPSSFSVRVPQDKDAREYKTYSLTNIQKLGDRRTSDLASATFSSSEVYPVAKLADANRVVIGSQIFVSGFPGLSGKKNAERNYEFVPGFVTSRPQEGFPKGFEPYTIRYEAVTKGGMSGGPVFDVDGRVVGIHGQGVVDSQSVGEKSIQLKTGFNAAVPINTFQALRSQFGQSAPKVEVDDTPSTDNPQQRLSNPQSASDYTARGAVRQEQGDRQGAVEDFNKAISLGSNNALTYFNRGVIRYNQGDMQGANEDFTQAISFAPDYELAYFNRGLARQILKDYQGMLEDFEQYMSFNSSDPVAFNNRASARAALGDRQGAITDLTEAIRLEPNLITAYNNRAILRRRMGDREGAIEDLSEIIRLDSNNATAYFNRGLVRRDVGNREGAIEDLQKAASLFQQKGDTSNYQTALEKIQSIQAASSIPETEQAEPTDDSSEPIVDASPETEQPESWDDSSEPPLEDTESEQLEPTDDSGW